ncbi:hypothetical protein A3L04_02615 [Thermococcus chitonophagus]|uniref:Glycosyltransferase n=1 Tax=Thermococcus chitonophagus TaxID=54262 RepID=A0A160VSA2_9EURY|nr:glycosyltransferase family 4 protein [Thermococcus chitonophagus]ASJ16048.1 hypothetical protein A3L04_02615 [Thermococcus chitonophagus]CUX77296.1 Glycosyltransferase [Thermococcus chitonophagus]
MKLTVIHNEIAPYRIPVFEELGKKYQVTVIFGKKKSSKRLWEISSGKNFEYLILRGIRVGDYVINIPTYKLFKRIKDSDVIIIADNVDIYPLVILSTVFAWIAKKPILMWVGHLDTGYISKTRKLKIIDEIIKRVLYSLVDSFVVYSSKSRKFLLRRGVPSSKISTGTTQVYPKMLLMEPIPSRKRDEFTVTSISYFEERKGLKYLIQALCGIPWIRVIIAGSGEYERILKREAGGCNNIEFPGYVTGKEKAELYSISDIFVFPTLHDPWGFVVNEAFYYGVPVITTTEAGASDIVFNGKNGFIVSPGDTKKIRELIFLLFENRKLLKKLSFRAKKIGIKMTDVSLGILTIERGIRKAKLMKVNS